MPTETHRLQEDPAEGSRETVEHELQRQEAKQKQASRAMDRSLTRPNERARSMARGLGWFSIGLGLCELLAPGTIKQNVGARGPRGLLQAYGAREIITGVAILSSDRPVTMTWARVAGDVLDLATLAPTLDRRNPHRTAAGGAIAFVALATAIDICVALQGDEIEEQLPDLQAA